MKLLPEDLTLMEKTMEGKKKKGKKHEGNFRKLGE